MRGFTVLVPASLRLRRQRARLVGGLLVLAAIGPALAPSAASATVPNPAWPGSCPQRFVLLLDQSQSMAAQDDEVQQAAEDLVDALRGTTNLLGVITFGTDARRDIDMTDVSDDEQRDRVKDHINELEILTGDAGGTNWEAALAAAEPLDPDVVLLVTDGQPSAHGVPADMNSQPEDPVNITAAVAAADRLKQAGSRVVGVGLGLDESTTGEANLVAVTGPALGDDYYTTGVHDLLPALYDVVHKSCAIPVDALPPPQRRTPDLLPLAGAAAAALALIVLVGLLLARRRAGGGPAPVRTAPRRTVLADPSISMDDIPPAAPSTHLAGPGDLGGERSGGLREHEAAGRSRPAEPPRGPAEPPRVADRPRAVEDPGAAEEPGTPARPRPPACRIKLPPPPPRGSRRDIEHD